jgi:hypothetical protein
MSYLTKAVLPFVALAAATVFSLSSCKFFVKKYGGSTTVEISKDEKLVNLSWKQTSLWVLTRVRKPGEQPETYQYQEDSNLGFLEGRVTIIEK